MKELIVVGFDNMTEAEQVATEFKAVRQGGGLRLDDLMVVVKDAEGKVQVKDEAGHPVAWGAVIGGGLGALLFVLLPVIGIAIGAAAGAAIAHWMDLGVDRKFVDSLSATLKPSTSAVFILVSDADHAAVIQALKPYKGTLLQTNVSPDMEDQLKRVLS